MTHHAGLDVSLAETAICIETRRASAVMRTMPDRTDRDDARPGPDHARRLVPAGPRPPCAPPAGAARRRPFHGGRGRPTPAATGWSTAGARGRWARIRVSPRRARPASRAGSAAAVTGPPARRSTRPPLACSCAAGHGRACAPGACRWRSIAAWRAPGSRPPASSPSCCIGCGATRPGSASAGRLTRTPVPSQPERPAGPGATSPAARADRIVPVQAKARKVARQAETPRSPDPSMRRPRADREEKRGPAATTHPATMAEPAQLGRNHPNRRGLSGSSRWRGSCWMRSRG